MFKIILVLSSFLLIAIIVTSCNSTSYLVSKSQSSNQNSNSTSSTQTEVTVGTQEWMGRNLDVDTFRNGDIILMAKNKEEFNQLSMNKKPVYCYYNFKSNNGLALGKLYNWYAVKDERGLAPDGWKIPSLEDWNLLIDFLGGRSAATEKLKYTNHWVRRGKNSGNGTNESGFSALPGGMFLNGFSDIGEIGFWWCSDLWSRNFDKPAFYALTTKGVLFDHVPTHPTFLGLSVRCVRHKSY